LSKLDRDRSELQTTVETLKKMSIPIPEHLLDNPQCLSDVQKILGEVAEEIKEMSLGMKRIESKLKGTFFQATAINTI
jgi:uncharacterized protein (DUF2342 family)